MALHTATGEWQSFEMRMRHRRAERLALRAEVAAEAGCLDDADTCLAEARMLAPGLAAVSQAERIVAGFREPPPPPAPPVRRTSVRYAAGATVAAAVIAGTLFLASSAGDSAPTGTNPPVLALAAPVAAPVPPSPRPSAVIPGTDRPVAAPADQRIVSGDPLREAAPTPQEFPAQSPPDVTPPEIGVREIGVRAPVTVAAAPAVESIPETAAVAGVIEPASLPAAPVSMPAPIVTEPSPETLVRGVLNQYAAAYNRLDAGAAQRVWPGVNRAALSRAFEGLSSQRVSLGNCAVSVTGAAARAQCAGSTTWSPRVGAGERTEDRRWTFNLARSGSEWRIVSASVQNR